MALSSASPCGPLTLPRLSVIFALVCLLYLVRDIRKLPSQASIIPHPETHRPAPTSEPVLEYHTDALPIVSPSFNDDCRTVLGADKVMVILKTGATEIYDKLPTQLVTLFRCTPHYLIFSDLAQTFSDFTVHDALETCQETYKEHHEDFELYRKLQKYHQEGQNPTKLKGEKGWDLDKWKFLPMLHETYRMAPPEVEWFLYIEADTSISWPNMLQFLQTMDPKDPLYLGAQNILGMTNFAHGGSGFIISRAAAKKMEDHREKMGADMYDKKWESLTSASCCGDEVLARALLEVDVPLLPSWPRIQGETVSTLDWTEKHWCTPALSWHHMSPLQADTMWQFQRQWVKEHGWQATYLYKDVFDTFVTRHISVNRTAWNNLSKDVKYVKPIPGHEFSDESAGFNDLPDFEKQSVESFEDCAAVCRAKDECLQWMWEPGRCHLGKDIRLGDSDDREKDHWISGWALDRIEKMRARLEPCTVRWTDGPS